MKFGTWYPLAAAADHAPAGPGVYQVRLARGLLDYPRGKSAMVHYAAAADLRAATTGFAARHPGADWLCRHTVEDHADHTRPAGPAGRPAPSDPAALAARLVRDFTTRFGCAPSPAPPRPAPPCDQRCD